MHYECSDAFSNPLEETRKIIKMSTLKKKKKDSFIKAFFMGKTEYVTKQTQFK